MIVKPVGNFTWHCAKSRPTVKELPKPVQYNTFCKLWWCQGSSNIYQLGGWTAAKQAWHHRVTLILHRYIPYITFELVKLNTGGMAENLNYIRFKKCNTYLFNWVPIQFLEVDLQKWQHCLPLSKRFKQLKPSMFLP